MKSFRERREELGFARVPLMARYANLVEVAMELVDDSRDLLRQVTGVHSVRLPAACDSGL